MFEPAQEEKIHGNNKSSYVRRIKNNQFNSNYQRSQYP